ncbi:MAG: class II fructose-bisphosphate aldolase [Oscillospiraceae bacterium]|nr:class II fructose-bisphosphate aldolase [Oscillospiraceae bacterium]
MLVTLNEILAIAEEKNCAIGAFNTPNLECITAVLNAAEKLNAPVIISHAELHESVAPLAVIGPVMVQAAKLAKVPVCVHLDHCETLSYMDQALKLGFTGVMYDGSVLPYKENVSNTRIAVALAKEYGANVEAEIGQLAAREGGSEENAGGPVYTDPDLAARFCAETGIDALAPSFGTAHGIYKSKPVLDLDRVKQIAEKTGLPLVMHGGSGVSDEDYRTAIRNGIRKINYYSYMAKAGVSAVKAMLEAEDVTFFHDLALAAQNAMEENAAKAMAVFNMT